MCLVVSPLGLVVCLEGRMPQFYSWGRIMPGIGKWYIPEVFYVRLLGVLTGECPLYK